MEEIVRKKLDELVLNFDEFTTSDLQGVIQAICIRYGANEDKCLEYIYSEVKEKQSQLVKNQERYEISCRRNSNYRRFLRC